MTDCNQATNPFKNEEQQDIICTEYLAKILFKQGAQELFYFQQKVSL